jgi:[acyl-carrier-protein] S-malonyltransferase
MNTAFIFPGQGSQSVGMMSAYGELPAIRATFAEASVALGEDLWQKVVEGPAEALARTVNTQPLMLTAGVAVYRAYREKGGPAPVMMAGHSLGEYAALVAAEALSLADALPLVRLRAQAMQEAVPEGQGAMAALLGLEANAVRAVCEDSAEGEVVQPANLNAPGQIVIAGNRAAVERAMVRAKEAGAKKAILLPVSAPFHCDLMRPAAQRLAKALSEIDIRSPRIPVLNNVDVAIETDPDRIRDALVRQAYSPVRWIELIERMAHEGITHAYECGPGKVLTGMSKRIAQGLTVTSIHDATSLETALAQTLATE